MAPGPSARLARGRTAAAARMPHPARIADDHDGGNHLIHIYMFLEQRQRTTSDF